MNDAYAIEKLIILYARLNDEARWEEVAALYVAEGRMSRPVAPDDFIEGRDAICAAFQSRPPPTTRHVCANVLVDVSGDTVTVHIPGFNADQGRLFARLKAEKR